MALKSDPNQAMDIQIQERGQNQSTIQNQQIDNSEENMQEDESNIDRNDAFIEDIDHKMDAQVLGNNPNQSTNLDTGIDEIINDSSMANQVKGNEDERISLGEVEKANMQTNKDSKDNNMKEENKNP